MPCFSVGCSLPIQLLPKMCYLWFSFCKTCEFIIPLIINGPAQPFTVCPASKFCETLVNVFVSKTCSSNQLIVFLRVKHSPPHFFSLVFWSQRCRAYYEMIPILTQPIMEIEKKKKPLFFNLACSDYLDLIQSLLSLVETKALSGNLHPAEPSCSNGR